MYNLILLKSRKILWLWYQTLLFSGRQAAAALRLSRNPFIQMRLENLSTALALQFFPKSVERWSTFHVYKVFLHRWADMMMSTAALAHERRDAKRCSSSLEAIFRNRTIRQARSILFTRQKCNISNYKEAKRSRNLFLRLRRRRHFASLFSCARMCTPKWTPLAL